MKILLALLDVHGESQLVEEFEYPKGHATDADLVKFARKSFDEMDVIGKKDIASIVIYTKVTAIVVN